jgi:hypothetical protein
MSSSKKMMTYKLQLLTAMKITHRAQGMSKCDMLHELGEFFIILSQLGFPHKVFITLLPRSENINYPIAFHSLNQKSCKSKEMDVVNCIHSPNVIFKILKTLGPVRRGSGLRSWGQGSTGSDGLRELRNYGGLEKLPLDG